MTVALALAFACGHAFVAVPASAAGGGVSAVCGWGLLHDGPVGWIVGQGPSSYNCKLPAQSPQMCTAGYGVTNPIPNASGAPSSYTCKKS